MRKLGARAVLVVYALLALALWPLFVLWAVVTRLVQDEPLTGLMGEAVDELGFVADAWLREWRDIDDGAESGT